MSILPAQAAALPRVATPDWAILETLLALGANLVAATELVQFRQIAVEPEVPAGVIDLGLRGTPNFEALHLAKPDLIFNSNFYASSTPRLAKIAPVESFSLFVPGALPFIRAEAMTLAIGHRTGLSEYAERFVHQTAAEIGFWRARINGAGGKPALLINFGDSRHFRIFGADSMFGETLLRLGIENSWITPTNYSAMAPIGLEALAQFPEAWIIVLGPVPADATRILPKSAFWNLLPNVRNGHVLTLESINPFGALPSARRFARLLGVAFHHAKQA